MPDVSLLQSNFNGGELSPSLHGRMDVDRYKQSLAICLNYMTLIQGPIDRRPGTYFVKETKTSALKSRLIPFQFSTTQAYMLEFGNLYVRFYANHGQVLDGGGVNPLEVVTPYLTADLPFLNFTQSGDVLYIVGVGYPPAKLVRLGATSWQYRVIVFKDGPYMLVGQSQMTTGSGAVSISTTVTPSATTGNGIDLTAGPQLTIGNCDAAANGEIEIFISAGANHNLTDGQQIVVAAVGGTTEANGTWFVRVIDTSTLALRDSVFVHNYTSGGTIDPSFFVATDVGRQIRLKHGTTWGSATIASFVSSKHVTANVDNAFGATTASVAFRMGAFCTLNGFPGTVTFHEDRLSFSGVPQFPQRIDCSKSSDYENFAPTALDGTVADNNALSFTLNSNDVNAMGWLLTDEKGLLGGSVGGEWLIRPSINQEAMTPTNISAKKTTGWGSQLGIAPALIGKATVFVQRGAKKIRELLFYFDIDGYRATDLTELSEHITGAGVVASAYQKIPQSIFWFVRADGALLGMTYERDMQNLKVGWHRHQLGGFSAGSGLGAGTSLGVPVIESIASIPSPDGTRDEVWMIVQRYINGGTKRYVEYMGKFFEDTDNQEDAHFVDCGAIYDAPIAIQNVIPNGAAAMIISSTTHGLSNGDLVTFRGIVGTTQLNYNRYVVTNASTNAFRLNDTSGNPVAFDITIYSPYISGGFVRKLVTTVSGLTWLEGETVDALCDGAVAKNLVVNSGVITLPFSAATVHIGFGYNSDAQLLRAEAGSADGTSLGKTRRMHRISLLLHRSLGLKFGTDPNNLDILNFRTDADPNNQSPRLFSGIKQETIEADYDFDNQLFLRQDEPLPSKILAVAMMMQTQDRR